MEMQYFKEYSPALGREMECKVYGHAGKPFLYIPCQDGRFFDFENYHMAETCAPWIEAGEMMVIAIDTIDKETWSDEHGDAYWRIRLHEQWIKYITEEVVPFIRGMAAERNGWESGVTVFGFSLGATHAANLYLRFPDLFDGLMALSGIYTAEYGFGSYMDGVVYQNSPVHYMANFPTDHLYMGLFNDEGHRAVICVGQGPWERPESTRQLNAILAGKGIQVWFDYWGFDCAHDWPWWYKQVVYFLPYLLGR